MQDKITVKGARTHNLKDIDVEIPRNKMVVFTGLSGSGKSSLAFDTIFAEGQRRYVESLSSYARQFLDRMQKPDVNEIEGLSPAISIDQSSRSNNPRSTVATITEIYDYLRILYARIGKPHCLECGRLIKKLSDEEILRLSIDDVKEKIKTLSKDQARNITLDVYAPVVRGRKGEYYQLLYDLLERGYARVLIDGEVKSLREKIDLNRTTRHEIDVLIDSITLSEFSDDSESANERLSEAIERALSEAEGLVRLHFSDEESGGDEESIGDKNMHGRLLSSQFTCPYDGYSFPEIEPRLFSFNSPYGACPECKGLGTEGYKSDKVCPLCDGARLRKEALNVFLGEHEAAHEGDTSQRKNIQEFTELSIDDVYEYFTSLDLTEQEEEISKVINREIESRLEFMLNVGIEYLTLDRRANTLSGGEAQRIRLASQLGSKLVGALYVLDEPTIGLHPRDNERLIETLQDLRDIGNTIIVVEHDEETIRASDFLVDIGPGAGVHGGEIVVADDLDKLLSRKTAANDSLTLNYLLGNEEISIPDKRRTTQAGKISVKDANIFNLKNINVDIPLGKFVAITGVSGSGKSSLMHEVVYENLRRIYHRRESAEKTVNAGQILGTEYLSRAVMIDQSPIGRTSRSNPATYTGTFDHVRNLFASTKLSQVRGWDIGRFSFNTPGGRCEACQGKGEQAIEMHFLPTVYVPCDICGGKRYTAETLEAKYNGKNIYEVLTMTVEEALDFFSDIPAIADRLQTLDEVGLGYIELGQPSTTLSGGEAQRVKISSELYRRHTQKTIYFLDEPTVGLHYEDVKKLITILQQLVEKGNAVVVIEHNMDLIKSVDHVIDMGPEGGEGGGQIVAKGTPEQVSEIERSYTGQYLKKVLE